MSVFLRAAYRVLMQERKPLSADELANTALSLGILETRGKTPAATMKSKLSVDILQNGERSKFKRTEAGHFSLREWNDAEYVAPRHKKAIFDEDVIVFPAKYLSNHIDHIGVSNSQINSRKLLADCFAMRRRDAEEDTSVIQLVSLFLVSYENLYLTYKRSRRLPESRLHGYYSLAFGGHLNPSDVANFSPLFDPFDPRHTCTFMERELHEELRLKVAPQLYYKGLVYDDSRDVSKQHLGILFGVTLNSPDFEIGERGFLTDPKFETAEQILDRWEQFENWSQVILKAELEG